MSKQPLRYVGLSIAVIVALYFVSQVVMAVLLIRFGADKPISVIIVNHTGKQMLVSADNVSSQLQEGASASVAYYRKDLTFSVEVNGDHAWHYRIMPISYREYSDNHCYWLQVERDGRINVLAHATDQPLEAIPPQPTGYPLHPLVEPNK